MPDGGGDYSIGYNLRRQISLVVVSLGLCFLWFALILTTCDSSVLWTLVSTAVLLAFACFAWNGSGLQCSTSEDFQFLLSILLYAALLAHIGEFLPLVIRRCKQ